MQQANQIQFPQNILKNLTDKNQEKRESACKDLEIIIRKNSNKKNYQQIQKMIYFFRDKYLKSTDLNKKKSGLQSLPFIINGIKNNSEAVQKLASIIIDIIIQLLYDNDHKVRYTALKSLYYICQALQQKILKFFNKIFQNIIGKITDLDQQTRNAARFLDSALQTTLNSALTNSQNHQDFNLKQFMRILKSKFKSMNPTIRQFLIIWVNALNQIVSVDLLMYLPDLLQDLLFMLGDKEKALRQNAQECLKNFQKQISDKFYEGKFQTNLNIQVIDNIINILIKVAKGKSSVYSKLTTLVWFKSIFTYFKAQLDPKLKIPNNKFYFKKIIIQRFDEILQPILLLMSNQQQQVRKASISANDLLMNGIQMINKEETINFLKVMPLLKEMLSQKKSTSTSQSVLKWMKFMLQNYNDKILPQINDIIQKLVQKVCQSHGKNVISIIQNTTVTQQYFELLIQKMLVLLLNRGYNDEKPQQILKKFCSILQPDKFCKTLASQVIQTFDDDKNFIFDIVQYLNLLIITEKSMLIVRKKLYKNEDPDFFLTLFAAFKYNPAAATSICLLSQQYELANQIILTLGREVEMTQSIILQFCKLVSLIESPGFLFLRLQMLDKRNTELIQCLCALLMVIPQGKISSMLKNRLQICQLSQNNGKNQVNGIKMKQSQINIKRYSVIISGKMINFVFNQIIQKSEMQKSDYKMQQLFEQAKNVYDVCSQLCDKKNSKEQRECIRQCAISYKKIKKIYFPKVAFYIE